MLILLIFQAIACITVNYVISIEDSYTLERNILMKPPSYCLSIRYTPSYGCISRKGNIKMKYTFEFRANARLSVA